MPRYGTARITFSTLHTFPLGAMAGIWEQKKVLCFHP
jgi:hypothetical protein